MKKSVVLYCSFNVKINCLSLGTREEMSILECGSFRTLYSYSCGPIKIVETLNCTDALAVVGAGDFSRFSDRQVTLWDTRDNSKLYEENFSDIIQAVKVNENQFFVCTKKDLFIYYIDDMKQFAKISVDSEFSQFSISPLSSIFAYSEKGFPGKIKLYDLHQRQNETTISAHKFPILLLTFNYAGTLLASMDTESSEIFVYDVTKREKLFSIQSRINCIDKNMEAGRAFSLCFNLRSTHLALSSSKGEISLIPLEIFSSEKCPTVALPSSTALRNQAVVPEDPKGLSNFRQVFKHCILLAPNVCAISEDDQQLFAYAETGKYMVWDLNAKPDSIQPPIESSVNNYASNDICNYSERFFHRQIIENLIIQNNKPYAFLIDKIWYENWLIYTEQQNPTPIFPGKISNTGVISDFLIGKLQFPCCLFLHNNFLSN